MTLKTKDRPEVAGSAEQAPGARPDAGFPGPAAPAPQRSAPSWPLLMAALLLVAIVAYFLGRGSVKAPGAAPPQADAAAGAEKKEGDATGKAEGGSRTIALEGEAEKTASIQVVSARSVALGDNLTIPGTVEVTPNRSARITPSVSGRIIELLAAPGDGIARGQRLAVLDSPEVAQAHAAVRQAETGLAESRAQVQTADAGVQQAQNKLVSAQAALERQQALARAGTFSQPSLQAAQNELNDAEAERAQAETSLQAQTAILERTDRLVKEELAARAELEQAQTAQKQEATRLERARQRVVVAKQALEREQKVFQGGLLVKQAVQTAEAEVRAAQGDLLQARKQAQAARTGMEGAGSALAAARANLLAVEGNGHAEGGAGRLALYSPIAGTVAARSASIGQAVERSSELFTLQNVDTVLVVAQVPEASVARVRPGASVEVTVSGYPGTRFTGVVQSVGSQVDEKTRTLPVRCLVQNRGGALKPEMFARVILSVGKAGNVGKAVGIPASAVDEDGEDRFVYVRTGSGTYEKRPVTVGRAAGDLVEIVRGVKPGDKVVTGGMFVLKSESKKGELKGDD